MTPTIRATLLAATLLAGSGGVAEAAEQSNKAAPAPGSGTAGSVTSVGAGGLTGSGATQDGTRRTESEADSKAGGQTAPAAGTTR